MRTEKEINEAKKKISNNENLTYGYKEDVTSILRWFLGEEESFDGLYGD